MDTVRIDPLDLPRSISVDFGEAGDDGSSQMAAESAARFCEYLAGAIRSRRKITITVE